MMFFKSLRRIQKSKKLEKVKSREKKKKLFKLTQRDFKAKISHFIISSMVPYRVLEDKYFSDIFLGLNIDDYSLQIPSWHSIV